MYGAQIYPSRNDDYLYIATICFDCYLRIWRIDISDESYDPELTSIKLLKEQNINEPENSKKTAVNKDVTDFDAILEDDILKMIMNPQDTPDVLKGAVTTDMTLNTERQKKVDKGFKSIMEKRHPNCLVFDRNDQLFIGDSNGHIVVFRIQVKNGDVLLFDPYTIKHKEIEGDQINQLIVHPENQNQIYVHSRDNCIRLIEFETRRGPRVKRRFFGSKCNNFMI